MAAKKSATKKSSPSLKVGSTTTGYSPKAGKKVSFKVTNVKSLKNGRKMAQGKDKSGNKVNRIF